MQPEGQRRGDGAPAAPLTDEELHGLFRAQALSAAESAASEEGRRLKRQVANAVVAQAWAFAETLAYDLALFAQHAKRSAVGIDDVLLAARRNPSVDTALRGRLGLNTEEPPAKRRRTKEKPPH
mmetsp:Transcript_8611/g.30102  ORF Transcript_8611/g.30102 Transcript_8611/m.30102 type:complete len:124 (+) Transcript_8611:168-539(+)